MSLQENAYERRLAGGATKASAWAASGIGLLVMVCILVALVAGILVTPDEWLGEDF